MHKVQDKPAQAAATLKFFQWAYKNGDKTADDLDYVPMPAVVKAQIEKGWARSRTLRQGRGVQVSHRADRPARAHHNRRRGLVSSTLPAHEAPFDRRAILPAAAGSAR
jgi:hypothetical protein